MHVGTIMESNDATFFEDIFPFKDTSNSSIQEIPTSSSQDLTEIPEPTISDRKSTRLNSSHSGESRMPSSA